MRELIEEPAAERAIPDTARHARFEVVADDVECLAPATTAG